MRNEILKRIDILAEKLGIAANQLWNVLVAQARIEGIQQLIWASFLLMVTAGLYKLYMILIELADKDDDWYPGAICAAIGGVVSFSVGIGLMIGALTPLLNPQYWAFRELMNQIGK